MGIWEECAEEASRASASKVQACSVSGRVLEILQNRVNLQGKRDSWAMCKKESTLKAGQIENAYWEMFLSLCNMRNESLRLL